MVEMGYSCYGKDESDIHIRGNLICNINGQYILKYKNTCSESALITYSEIPYLVSRYLPFT